ncbi:MAG: RNA polymerase sigma factor [Rhizobiaceae bacterium]
MLAIARRHARPGIEADDLLQDALTVALTAGRNPDARNRAWLAGTMRNLAAMAARSAGRRRRREEHTQTDLSAGTSPEASVMPELEDLPPALRIVALLALSGHNRVEIRHLLRISDTALRQRISGIRRIWSKKGGPGPHDFVALGGSLAFGSIRRSLLPLMRVGRAHFASHDPDGHPIAFSFSTRRPHETGARGNQGK